MSNTDGFTERIELIELREKNKRLIEELHKAKTYLELAFDRTDPYPAINDGIKCVRRALANES